MKKSGLILLGALFLFGSLAQAQNDENRRVVTTGVPFLLIAGDARASGLGDMGVATAPDSYSQQWNPAKYAFVTDQQGVAISYTPYLRELVTDINLGSLTYYNRINERSAFAASLRYFSLGEIELRQTIDETPTTVQPNELALDFGYSLKLSERFAMGVTGRFINSNLRIPDANQDASGASTFGVDISGYYQSEETPYNNFDGRWRGGFNISNIGPKLKYDDTGQENFIPTNLRLGGGFDFILDFDNKISALVEVNKLLVPTPPSINRNPDGTVTDESQQDIENYDNTGSFEGIFSSFGDAPNGFSEELKEFTWAIGAEYWYQDSFSFRAGYFNESEDKGFRKFATIGAGFKYTIATIDVSYLFSTSQVNNPLEGTLRFSLSFNFGEKYLEY